MLKFLVEQWLQLAIDGQQIIQLIASEHQSARVAILGNLRQLLGAPHGIVRQFVVECYKRRNGGV